MFIKNTSLEKRTITLQEKLAEKTLGDRLSSLETQLIKKKVGGKIINTKKPIEVFDVENVDERAQPFEIDEITKVTTEEENQSDTGNSQPEKENKSLEIHEDEDTSRIGREGDLLEKRKKI